MDRFFVDSFDLITSWKISFGFLVHRVIPLYESLRSFLDAIQITRYRESMEAVLDLYKKICEIPIDHNKFSKIQKSSCQNAVKNLIVSLADVSWWMISKWSLPSKSSGHVTPRRGSSSELWLAMPRIEPGTQQVGPVGHTTGFLGWLSLSMHQRIVDFFPPP